jgi:putative tryptophan/tyrosine transport system substrate-binding protein
MKIPDTLSLTSATKNGKAFSVALCAWLFVAAIMHGAIAQEQPKIPEVIFFVVGTSVGTKLVTIGRYEEFTGELRSLGYTDKKNIALGYITADGDLTRLPALADEVIRRKPAVIVTRGTPESLALKKASSSIPIVFYSVTDPVGAGLVESLARPSSNFTGFSSIEAVLIGKRLELLKEVVPKVSRVAVLWNPDDTSSAQQWKEAQRSAQELNLQLHSMEVGMAEHYEDAFKAAISAGTSALSVIAGSLEDANAKRISNLALKNRMATIYPRDTFVMNGGLMSYGSALGEPIKRVALMVDKILKGTKTADIPVEQAKQFTLVVNLKTAKQIGLTIPPNVLARADKVIK